MAGVSMVKMKKPGKRRALNASWEGPYQFVGHADGKGDFDFEEGCRICIVQDADGRQWERSRKDLQIYYTPCHDNSSDTQAYLDSARYCKLKVSGLQAIAVTAS